ncbi:MAG: GTPase HflX, partial [Omnitrophica bacterium RIFCSPHIGHO2_02_FULL_63_14]
GSGKAAEIAETAARLKAEVVVFEDDLSPSQQRNLETLLNVKTIDRTQLILDIFASRARMAEGKVQVELAQLQYLLPRLAGKGVELSRLGGGVGTRGPGEQKLETDRRRIRARIARLTSELKELKNRRHAGLERKKEMNLPVVALVGYTHAGKSTLFNALTDARVEVRHRLFSTLDTITRLIRLPHNQQALLVDTVGFIRDLPHHLVESFKATLEETIHADLLLHVADASRPDLAGVEAAVRSVLESLGVETRDVLKVFSKADLVAGHPRPGLYVSAKTGEGLKALREALALKLSGERRTRLVFVPRGRLGLVPLFYKEGEVLGRRDRDGGAELTVSLSDRAFETLCRRLS